MRTEKLHYAGFSGEDNSFEFQFSGRIINDTLILTRTGQLSKSYSKNWIYSLRDIQLDQLPSFVHSYIGISKKEFIDFANDVEFTGGLTNSNLYVFHDSLTATYNHEKCGSYEVIRTKSNLKSFSEIRGAYEYLTIIGKLDDHTYWLRKETVKR